MTRLPGLALIVAALTVSAIVNAEEFDGYDAMSLSQSKRVETDCSITWKNPKDGKTYCFANARNQFMFKQNVRTFVPRAQKAFDEN
ncbi:MAG: hypothetical protein AMJ66_10375 [Betaproteobacteria bacterium SG8_40]|jgi:YHS domain-containing protein|nr:MAG: hypothetical protein AMJ66_10375 [Betaproteobacteria bacterium SG8_40]